METLDLSLSLPVQDACALAEEVLVNTWQGLMTDTQDIVCKSGRISILLFAADTAKRKGMQAIVVTIDNLTGDTRIHAAKAGENAVLENFRQKKDAFALLEDAFASYRL